MMTEEQATARILAKFDDDTLARQEIEAWLAERLNPSCNCDDLLHDAVENAVTCLAAEIGDHAVIELEKERERLANRKGGQAC